MKRSKTFSLIELLVTISIIGILMAIAINAYSNSKVKAKDVQRKADIMSIAHALETYKSANGVYAPAIKNDTCKRVGRSDISGLGDCFYNINTTADLNSTANFEPLFSKNSKDTATYDMTAYLLNITQQPKKISNGMPSGTGSFPDNTSVQSATTIPFSTGTINYRVQNTYYVLRIALESKSTSGTLSADSKCLSTGTGNYSLGVSSDNWRTATYAVPGTADTGANSGCGLDVYKIYQLSSLTSLR